MKFYVYFPYLLTDAHEIRRKNHDVVQLLWISWKSIYFRR